MYDFVSHILRRYFEATGWNEYNSYLNLTASSSAVLDFPVPTGLSLSISACPTPPFFTSYRLGALPNLRAGIGYIYASTDVPLNFGGSSRDVRFKDIIERFRIVEAPKQPQGKDAIWLAGTRVDSKDYLIYGCMHVPSARLDALYTARLSPTWQLIATAVSTPPKYPLAALQQVAMSAGTGARSLSSSVDRLDASASTASLQGYGNTGSLGSNSGTAANSTASNAAAAIAGAGPPGSTNLQLTLQRDTGRWFTEYSYSFDDALWGFRVLHNFGSTDLAAAGLSISEYSDSNGPANTHSSAISPSAQPCRGTSATQRRIDEAGDTSSNEGSSSDAGGGLRGRFSAGAEVFISTVEKSAGVSTGIRFSTLPEYPIIPPGGPKAGAGLASRSAPSSPSATPSQPPTVITATLNPMMGHLSTAYAARMARDVVVCSRFDFNVYSYESEWTVGAEYWLRSPLSSKVAAAAQQASKLSSTRATSSEPGRVPRQAQSAEQPSLRDDVAPASVASNVGPMREGAAHPTSLAQAAIPTAPASLRDPAASPAAPDEVQTGGQAAPSWGSTLLAPITGVLKARISTTSDIRLLWQGRLRNCLISLGVKADLDNHTLGSKGAWSGGGGGKPRMSVPASGIVKSIGVEVMYFSQAEDEPELAGSSRDLHPSTQHEHLNGLPSSGTATSFNGSTFIPNSAAASL